MDRLDQETREHLVQIALRYETFTKKLTWLARAFVVLFIVVMALNVRVQAQLRDGVTKLQDARVANIARNCAEVNGRNTKTVATLHAVVVERLKQGDLTASQRDQIKNSATGTISIIDALSPKRDCKKLAAEAAQHQKNGT